MLVLTRKEDQAIHIGSDVVVKTLDDKKIKLKIASGTENGKLLRIKGEGVPLIHGNGKRGDMYVKLQVQIPKKLNGKERDILKQFSDKYGEDEQPTPIRLKDL